MLASRSGAWWCIEQGFEEGGENAVSSDDRGQPAEAGLAGGDRKALAEMEARGRSADAGAARRGAGMDQAPGRCRDFGRQRWRAVSPAFRAWFPGERRGYRLA